MSRLVYACSTNPGKLAEFQMATLQCVSAVRLEILPGIKELVPPEETGATFEANAALKARAYSSGQSELVFADDSGLEVDALGGAPGVFSARFAGPHASDEENNRLLLERLAGAERRTARFVCLIALARAGSVLETFSGSVDGKILHEPRGDNGFGYDPLFYYPPLGRSLAELSAAEKFKISHRGIALCNMLRRIDELAPL